MLSTSPSPFPFPFPSVSPSLPAPPSLTQHPQNVSAPVGSAAIFTCVANGNPAPSIIWRDPANQIIQNSSKFSLSDSGLSLSPVGRGDGGWYTCHAHSRAGTATSSAFLDVQCKCTCAACSTSVGPSAAQPTTDAYKRSLLLSPTDAPEASVDDVTVTSVTGDTAALPCHITGNPAPSYTWLKDGVEVAAGGTFSVAQNGTLVIGAVSKAVEGRFVCAASNPFGSATTSVQLRVLGEWEEHTTHTRGPSLVFGPACSASLY